MRQEFPTGETPKQASTFISTFIKVKDDFSKSDFRVPGWVHSSNTTWWARIVRFVLRELKEPSLECGLYHAVRAVRYGIAPIHYHFFMILEKYNSNSCTFFTPVGELGFALHEMFEVS